ncbi:hypothetical protein 7712_00085 [Pseudomonas phage bmx-p2]|nr:hypothetical protein 7712_00085 [Pseudomonas phage bmx-p2]
MPQAVQLFADVVGRVMLAIDRSRFVEFPAEGFRLNDGADFQSATGFLLVSPGTSPNELMGEVLADTLDLENEVHELERRADGVQHVLPVVELFGLGHGRRVLAAHAGGLRSQEQFPGVLGVTDQRNFHQKSSGIGVKWNFLVRARARPWACSLRRPYCSISSLSSSQASRRDSYSSAS